MSDAPDECAMILGDPGETVSLDTIKAMARAVRDAGFVAAKDRCTHQWAEYNFAFGTQVFCELCNERNLEREA